MMASENELRREIAQIQRLNLAYLQTPKPDFVKMNDHARREQRLKDIMHELKLMTERKKLSVGPPLSRL